MAKADVIVEEFDDLGFTLTEPQIIDNLASEIRLDIVKLDKLISDA